MFKRLAIKMNNIRIKKKLTITYVLTVFIPVLLVGLLLTAALRQMAVDNAIRQSQNNMEKIKKRTEEVFKVPMDISNKIFIDEKLERIVNTQYESNFDVVKTYWEYPDLKDAIRLNAEIANIRLYVDNPTILNNWEFFNKDDHIAGMPWFKEALMGKGKIGWYYISDETRANAYYISLVRMIPFNKYRSNGMLVISLNSDYLNAILDQEQFETMIVTQDGYVAAAKTTHFVGKTIQQLNVVPHWSADLQETSEIVFNDKPSEVVIYHFLPDASQNGLTLISVVPIQDIVRETQRISMFGISIIALSLIVALILIYIFSTALSSRILRLSQEIHKVARGNLHVTSPIEGEDEIGQVSRHFNGMVRSIRELMSEVALANQQKNQLEIKQKEIKLKMLANQIKPHFLFNVLEAIRMKAHIRGEKEIEEATRLLGKLMRRNLEIGSDLVLLAEEIDVVRSYLEIQKFRYGDRLSYRIEVDASIDSLKILPLIIQPLVENAVVHGLENKEDSGTVRVTAAADGVNLQISVTDDGIGMSETELNSIRDRLNDSADEMAAASIGLRNIHQRIKLYYGGDSALTIASQRGLGTSVVLTIPMEVKPNVV